jgi:hypothetical protein
MALGYLSELDETSSPKKWIHLTSFCSSKTMKRAGSASLRVVASLGTKQPGLFFV